MTQGLYCQETRDGPRELTRVVVITPKLEDN